MMQIPVEISFCSMVRSESLASHIQEKASKLAELYDRIARCQVVVELPHRSHHRGNLYHVGIQLSVPKRELIVHRELHERREHENPYTAINDAFDAIRRQLIDYVQERRDGLKSQTEALHGQITRICLPEGADCPEKGYGFISTFDGREVYFHASSLVDVGLAQLDLGSEVRFIEKQEDQDPQATSVQLVVQNDHLLV